MRKTLRILLCIVLFLPFMLGAASAQEESDPYGDAVEQFEDYLPESVRDELSSEDSEKNGWQTFVSQIKSSLSLALPDMKRALLCMFLLCVCAALARVFDNEGNDTILCKVISGAGFLSVYTCVKPLITQSFSLLEGISDFALAFVPAYAGVAACSGQPLASAAYSSALIIAVNALVLLSESVVLPLVSMGLAFCAAGCLYTSKGFESLNAGVFRAGKLLLVAVCTLFAAVTSLQSVINGVSDSAAISTGRFFVGTAVPVVGARITESMSTVLASLKIVKANVGIAGIVGVLAMCAPVLVSYLAYSVVLACAGILSGFSGSPSFSAVIARVKDSIDICCGLVFSAVSMIVFSSAVLLISGR